MTTDHYFITASGKRHTYAEIADRIRSEAPHTLGQHISVQLEAIGLLDEMRSGRTPFGLPFTFAEKPRPMTKYIVHLYREMRLTYADIEADTPQAAAAITRDKPTGDADDVNECDGETSAAHVDMAGDEDYSQSVTVDFEPEQQRKAAPKLLAALEAFLEADQLAEQCHEWKWENLESAFTLARVAIAEATDSGLTPAPADSAIQGLLATRRQIAAIWSIEDVLSVRPDLNAEQCWEVLEQVGRKHDAGIGITWNTLEFTAHWLFGNAPETDEPKEA